MRQTVLAALLVLAPLGAQTEALKACNEPDVIAATERQLPTTWPWPRECSQECDNAAFQETAKWADRLYRWADQQQDSCEKFAYLHWAEVYRQKAVAAHAAWEKRSRGMPMMLHPPSDAGEQKEIKAATKPESAPPVKK